MAELLITFIVSLLVIGSLAWVMSRSKNSQYRPTRQQIVTLFESVLDGTAQQNQWDLFIGYPLYHDPELELLRLLCIKLTNGDPDTEPMGSGIGTYLFDRSGRERVQQVLEHLQKLIAEEPYQQDF
ncbi:MAG: hypothetical protein V7752_21080 [Halopseudomonas sp.]